MRPLTVTTLRETLKEMRPFLLRQLVAVVTLVLLLTLTAGIVPLFFRLSGDAFDAKAARRVSTPLIEVEFYGWVIASVFFFVAEFRHGLTNTQRVPQNAVVRAQVFSQSETTAATPSFVEGFGAILDLGGTLTEYNDAPTGEEVDAVALRHDGLMVGRDLRQAMVTSRDSEAYGKRRSRPVGSVNG